MIAAEAPFTLTAEQRSRFAKFADCLISGGSDMPSASEAEVHGPWIERTIAARPDLGPIVHEVLAFPGEPAAVLETLRAQSRTSFEFFAFAVAGAYLINPRIRKMLGYPGPTPAKNPAFPDEAESYLEDGILDVVIQRGPIYRPTPRA
jgi:hypothetical protein